MRWHSARSASSRLCRAPAVVRTMRTSAITPSPREAPPSGSPAAGGGARRGRELDGQLRGKREKPLIDS
jgi:hypothetical protein